MKEGCIDFYEEIDEGCCLHCLNAHPGCLCFDCKCKKCYWYSSPIESDGEKGHCDKTDELVDERKEEIKRFHIEQGKLELKKANKLIEYNKNIKKPMNNNWYSCQKCRREFISKKDEIIVIGEKPICPLCSGEIIIKKEEENGNS